MNWISQLIGAAMQDLSFDMGALVPTVLPVLPDLEFLEGPPIGRIDLISPSMLSGMLSKMPNLKEMALESEAAQGDPFDTIPALAHLERVVCHVTWLGFLVPGRPVTTAKVLCDSRVRGQELFEILHNGSVPLHDLTLTYPMERENPTWSPDCLEPAARHLPELEIIHLRIYDQEVDGQLKKALFHISQLKKLRIVSVSFGQKYSGFDLSCLLDESWQESNLREFLGLTKSRVLERVGFDERGEWTLKEPQV
ncbi:hypothetical protein FS837_007188, partial [Tulasnella sp. UAMH 9824]